MSVVFITFSTGVRISSTFSVLRPTDFLPLKPYFDFFDQTLLRPRLYFSTNKKSRFDKMSKYRGRSKRVDVERKVKVQKISNYPHIVAPKNWPN